ncbi:MAG: hypothetical protein RI983_888 [Bacteroidota bacterium]|jgi:hypothetical protein
MKRIYLIILGLTSIVLLNSCVKNELPVFVDPVVEFDAAAWNANGAGLTYPILTRVAGYGRSVGTSDPILSRSNTGVKKFRINLIGKQLTTETDVFVILGTGTTAQAEKHFRVKNTPVKIPAKSSFGEIEIEILNPGSASSTPVDLNLTISGGTNNIKVSENYKTIGLRISQL